MKKLSFLLVLVSMITLNSSRKNRLQLVLASSTIHLKSSAARSVLSTILNSLNCTNSCSQNKLLHTSKLKHAVSFSRDSSRKCAFSDGTLRKLVRDSDIMLLLLHRANSQLLLNQTNSLKQFFHRSMRILWRALLAHWHLIISTAKSDSIPTWRKLRCLLRESIRMIHSSAKKVTTKA